MPSVLMGSDILKKAVVCDILHAIFSQNSPSLCSMDELLVLRRLEMSN